MIDTIWVILIISSVTVGIMSGNIDNTVNALTSGAKRAVELTLFLTGSMAFWMGMNRVAEASGILDKVSDFLSPVINLLFPKFKGNAHVKSNISANLTANIFGLGNAATPLGIKTMDSLRGRDNKITSSEILFILINTSSLQLIPTSMAALRSAYGSKEPFSIIGCVIFTSLLSLTTCVIIHKLLEVKFHE